MRSFSIRSLALAGGLILAACAPGRTVIPSVQPGGGAAAVAAADGGVPSPEEVLGFQVGADGRLAAWADIVDYFEKLNAATPMMRLERIGESVGGRPMLLAAISSPDNIARLPEIEEAQARLADPRGASKEELEALAAKQPAVIFIGAALHGNEIMGTQMAMELAYDLVTDQGLKEALERVVVLLVPGMNPDGLDITRDWWQRTRKTPHEGAPMPWLYHHYTGHDNNRDFFMITQAETKAVTRVLYERWFPQVVLDVHQMRNRGARFFIPPFADPLNPNVDPLIVRMTNLVGVQMAADLTAAGKTGVSHQRSFDLWWHGGGRTVPARHNMIGILTEAANAYYGDPIEQSRDELTNEPEVGSMYPEPWEGGWWRPRDIVEYELIASKSLVNLVSRQREQFIGNWQQVTERQIRLGEEGGPFAYVIPADQEDPFAAAELLRVLRRGGAEVHRAKSNFRAGDREYPAGSHVVLLGQPFRAHIKDLLEVQRYPDRRLYPGGPPQPPYDLAGWTLPLQMGVEVAEIESPFPTTGLEKVDSIMAVPAIVAGSGGAGIALDGGSTAAYRAAFEVWSAGGEVAFAPAAFRSGGREWPAGTPIVHGLDDIGERAARWASDWGLRGARVDVPATGARSREGRRVALYKPWTASMDEGWTRWLFEEWGVPFDTIDNRVVKNGRLGDRYDAIVIPAISYARLMNGYGRRAHPDYAGGVGRDGAAQLKAFVEEGGTLILLDSSVDFAIRYLGLPIERVNKPGNADADSWYAPGSILQVEWDRSNPLAHGMPERGGIFYARSPVLEVAPDARDVRVVARYPEPESILLSGYAQHPEQISGKAAMVEADLGHGKVVLFAFRPQHRAQPYQTFKPLFNALLRAGDQPARNVSLGEARSDD